MKSIGKRIAKLLPLGAPHQYVSRPTENQNRGRHRSLRLAPPEWSRPWQWGQAPALTECSKGETGAIS
eukprot:3044583-Pyramimonas_sp.AAC.1